MAGTTNVVELGQERNILRTELTPRKNTVLHVAAQFGQVDYLNEVLKVCPSSLLLQRNDKNETPLHMAARDGQAEIVKALIVHAEKQPKTQDPKTGGVGALEQMLRATNDDGDTALHMAARYCHLEEGEYLKVVELLTEKDQGHEYLPSKMDETPLYLAAERGDKGVEIVRTLMKNCRSLTYSGPRGRTALHAAALTDSTGKSVKMLLANLEGKKNLINKEDAYGWTPLHYATYNKSGNGVEELLHYATSNKSGKGVTEPLATDNSGASSSITTPSKDGLETLDIALHIAAAHGHELVVQKLLLGSPDCWEMVNKKGQSILHIAVDMNNDSVIKFILDQPWVRHLINQKDDEGNTPLHLLISSDCRVDKLWKHPRADHQAFNHENMTPIDLVWSSLTEERMSTFATEYILDDTLLESGTICRRSIAWNAHENLIKLERARTKEKQKRQQRLIEAERLIAAAAVRLRAAEAAEAAAAVRLTAAKAAEAAAAVRLTAAEAADAAATVRLTAAEAVTLRAAEAAAVRLRAAEAAAAVRLRAVEAAEAAAAVRLRVAEAAEAAAAVRLRAAEAEAAEVEAADSVAAVRLRVAEAEAAAEAVAEVRLRAAEAAEAAEAERFRKERLREESKKLLKILVIVASLLATITFGAAFAIPGGYDVHKGRHEGLAVLVRAAAFKAFFIINTLAMVSSLTSVLLCITALGFCGAQGENNKKRGDNRITAALGLITFSMFAILGAFIAATFAILPHSRLLLVSTCVIVGIGYIVYFYEIVRIFI